MEKIDYKKKLKHLYKPSSRKVEIVEVPPMNFLMIDGEGDPNTSQAFQHAVEALFPLAYTLKSMVKKGGIGIDYGVLPLEALWWADDMSVFTTGRKDAWKWTLMIMQPEFITRAMVEAAAEEVERKKKPISLNRVRFETFKEGKAAQTLHIGPFSAEGPTIEKVHSYIETNGSQRVGKHHEIYLSDIRRTASERWKTIVRQPMFDRQAHWENVYQKRASRDVSWYQKEPSMSLALITNTQIASDAPIIDIGGGTSRLVDHLCKAGFSNLAVLDISEKALSSAQKRLGNSAQHIKWYVSDITQFTAPHPFSLWHDRAVFHFLTDQSDRSAYVKALKQALKPGGHLIISTFAIGGPEKCSGLDIVQYDSEKLTAELGESFKLMEVKNETHITPANKAQKFMYFHFMKIAA